jgi:type II secretory pathway pseudopilin PulG
VKKCIDILRDKTKPAERLRRNAMGSKASQGLRQPGHLDRFLFIAHNISFQECINKYIKDAVMKILRLTNKLFLHNCGFSVVELMIAMVIILLLAITVTPMIVFTAQTTNYNKAKATAKSIANGKIEEIRAMTFASLGVTGGNPSGSLQPSETVTVDGRSYTITTDVNWVDLSGCFAEDHAEWDVKMATVTVTANGFFNDGDREVTETIESLISRDSEQPLYLGANIRVCVFRGWDYETSDDPDNPDYQPVSGVKVTVTDQNNNTTLVGNTVTVSSRSFVLFLSLNASSYKVEVDPSFKNMIVKPGTYPQEGVSVALDTTQQMFAYVEYPGLLDIYFYDSDNNPVEIIESGTIELLLPDIGFLERTISATSSSGQIVPSNLFNDLWPHPVQQAKAYSFTSFTIPGHLILLDENNSFRVWDVAKGENWKGYFEGPGTTINLIIYLWKMPVIDESDDLGDSWLKGQGNSTVIDGDLVIEDRVAQVEEILKPGIFNRDKTNDSYGLSTKSPNFIASELIFKGSNLDISNNASLILHANYVSFENIISLSKNSSTIILNTIKVEDCDDDDFYRIVWPDTDEEMLDLDCCISKIDIIHTVKGSELGVSVAPWNNHEYGIVYFEKDVFLGQSGEPVILKGAYYFPDGFDFAADHVKLPEEGGLVLFAQ